MDTERLENASVAGLRRVFGSRLLGVLALVTGVASLGLVFGYASDSMYGVSHGINLIAYWHIAVAWVAAVALTVTFVGSILYLVTDTKYWSYLAHASGEAGFLFVTLTLVNLITSVAQVEHTPLVFSTSSPSAAGTGSVPFSDS